MENGLQMLMAAAAGLFGAGFAIALWMKATNDVEVGGGKKVSVAKGAVLARLKKYGFSALLGFLAGGIVGAFGPEWGWTTMQILGAALGAGAVPESVLKLPKLLMPSH